MKVLNVISEASMWDLFSKPFRRRVFRSTAEELAYNKSVKDLSEALYKAQLDTSKVDSWAIVKPHVQGTPMNNKEFVQGIYDDAYALAEKQINKELKDFKKKNPNAVPTKAASEGFNKRVLFDALVAVGIYDAIQGPLDDYEKRISWATYKLNLGSNPDPKAPGETGWTQKQYDAYIREETGIMIGRLSVNMIGFAGLGVGLRAFQSVVGAVPKLGFVAPTIPDGAARQAFYLMWAQVLNSKMGIPGSESISTDGKQLTAKQLITQALLAEIPLIPGNSSIADWLGAGGNLAINLLHGLYEKTYKEFSKYGQSVGINVDPVWFGYDARPTVAPAKRTPNRQAPAPEAPEAPEAPNQGLKTQSGEFNPNDWVKTKSGYYQNKFDRTMISPTEYNQRAGGQSD